MDITADTIIKIAGDYAAGYKEKLEGATLDHETLYANPKVRAGIDTILKEMPVEKISGDADRKRAITYFSGALGAYNILAFAEKPELKELREKNISVSFAHLKNRFTELTGIPCDPYANVRPLMHALHGTYRSSTADMILDETLAPSGRPDATRITDELREESRQNDVRIYAVALKPEEAIEEAKKLGLDAQEAERTARNFCGFFPELCKAVPNVQLMDREMNVIYSQVNGITKEDPEKMKAWRAACMPDQNISQGLPDVSTTGYLR